MKYIALFVFLLPVSLPAQNVSYMLSGNGLQVELAVKGESASYGLISNLPGQSYGFSLAYHPLTFGKKIPVTPYFRLTDGAHYFNKLRKMYGYDFGIKASILVFEYTTRRYVGKGTQRYVQFGVHFPIK